MRPFKIATPRRLVVSQMRQRSMHEGCKLCLVARACFFQKLAGADFVLW